MLFQKGNDIGYLFRREQRRSASSEVNGVRIYRIKREDLIFQCSQESAAKIRFLSNRVEITVRAFAYAERYVNIDSVHLSAFLYAQ